MAVRVHAPRAGNEGFTALYSSEMWGKGTDYYAARVSEFGSPGGTLLDVGCGPGQWAAAALAWGMNVTACDVDLSPGAVALLSSLENLQLVKASAAQLPFEESAFDTVLCELVLPYVNVERALAEVARVLRHDGVVHGICHGPGYYLMRWFSELLRWKQRPRRRAIVLMYTLAHRMCGLKEYHYETFQTARQIRNVLLGLSFTQILIRNGGHPTITRAHFAGLPCFFEFTARSNKSPER